MIAAQRGFEVYAPVAFGSITGINPVTADRAITLQMARGTDQATINRVVDTREPHFGAIRASLYRLALVHGPTLGGFPLTALVPPFITGRHRELFLPLFVIAELAGGTPFRNDVFRVSMQTLGERESLPEDGRALFYALERRLLRSPQLTIYPGDLVQEISDALGMDTDRGKRIEPRKVGSLLRRYGYKRGQETNKGIPYTVTRSQFQELAGLYGYPIAEDFPGA
jgi:hypothetical protein